MPNFPIADRKLRTAIFAFMFAALSFATSWAGLTKTEVSQLYVSIFNRASEGEENAYWQTQPDMAAASTVMLDTDAAKNYFGASLNSNQAFIEHIYLNALNKTLADDPGGIAYWVGELSNGKTRGSVVSSLVGVIKDYAPGGPYYNANDAKTVAAYNRFTNRVTVSNHMADNVEKPPASWATSTSFNSGLIVTDDATTVTSARTSIDEFTGIPPGYVEKLGVIYDDEVWTGNIYISEDHC